MIWGHNAPASGKVEYAFVVPRPDLHIGSFRKRSLRRRALAVYSLAQRNALDLYDYSGRPETLTSKVKLPERPHVTKPSSYVLKGARNMILCIV